MKKRTKSYLEYIAFRLAKAILRLCPYVVIRSFLIGVFRAGMWLGIRTHVARENLKMVFPDHSKQQIKSIIKEVYRNMAITAAESFFCKKEKLYEQVRLEGWENLQEAQALGRGVLMASAHMGNWELAGPYIATHYPLGVIYKPLRNRFLDAYLNRDRIRHNILLIEKKTALRGILKALAEHYIVTIMVDQNARRDGIVIDFLGYPASTFTGVAKIAIKTGAPIIIAIAVRQDQGKHRFHFEKLIDPQDFSPDESGVRELTSLVTRRIEKYILAYPGQWFWVHRRWAGVEKARRG